MNTEIVFTIGGTPVGKGSLKCVGRNGHHRLIEDNPHTAGWRDLVAAAATQAADDDNPVDDHQPIGVEFTATLPRPQVHYGTGRNTTHLKPNAPAHPTNLRTGDIDKLARLVLDALQDAGILHDDAQVVELLARKAYLDDLHTTDALTHPGIRIRIYPITHP